MSSTGKPFSFSSVPRAHLIALVALTIVGGWFRWYNLNWDGDFQFHSDERNVVMCMDRIVWSEGRLDPEFYVYGAFPVYVADIAHNFLSAAGLIKPGNPDHSARVVSAFFATITIPMLYVLGAAYFGAWVGLVSAAMMAFSVQHIQGAHFGTVESMLTFIGLLIVFSVQGILKRGSTGDYLFCGLCLGVGMATKFSALSFVLPYLIAHLAAVAFRTRESGVLQTMPMGSLGARARYLLRPSMPLWIGFVLSGVVTAFVGFAGAPHQILKWDRLQYAMNWEGGVVTGRIPANYVQQFRGTTPYLYQISNMIPYHLGMALGLTAFLGFLYALFLPLRSRNRWERMLSLWIPGIFVCGYFLLTLKNYIVHKNVYLGFITLKFPYWNDVVLISWLSVFVGLSLLASWRTKPFLIVFLSWPLFYFGFTGGWQVKFMRYMLPVVPFFFICGAKMLDDLRESKALGSWARFLGNNLAAIVVFFSFLYSLAFMSIYMSTHTRTAAYNWLRDNARQGQRVIIELWEDNPPMPPGLEAVTFDSFENDSEHKVRFYSKELAGSDYVLISSKRVYDSIFMLEKDYRYTTSYFRGLYAGDLGYELAQTYANFPSLLGYQIVSEEQEGTFCWFDNPRVQVFRNKDHLSSDEIARRIENPSNVSKALSVYDLKYAQAGTPTVPRIQPKKGLLEALFGSLKRGTAATPVDQLPDYVPRNRAPEKIVPMPPPERPASPMTQVPVLWWLILLELMALVTFPITFIIFDKLPDRGFAFGKVVGITLTVYLTWILVALGFFEFSREIIFLVLSLLAFVSLAVGRSRLEEMRRFLIDHWTMLLAYQLFYLVFFGAFLLLRMQNPDLYWSEKPMDLSFTNSFLRSKTFPAENPWYAGYAINYYYFMHVTLAVLTKISEIPVHITFNLMVATVAGLTGLCAFGIVYVLSRRYWVAVLAAIAPLVLGQWNWLAQALKARQLLPNYFDWWNAAHETIRGTINEFPYWSFLFSDLHAHVVAFPFFMMVVGLQMQLLFEGRPGMRAFGPTFSVRWWLTFLFAVVSFGYLLPLNTWDIATLGSLYLVIFAYLRFFHEGAWQESMERAGQTAWRTISGSFRKRGGLVEERPLISPGGLAYHRGVVFLPRGQALYHDFQTLMPGAAVATSTEKPLGEEWRWMLGRAVSVLSGIAFDVLAPFGFILMLGMAAVKPYFTYYAPISYGVVFLRNPTANPFWQVMTIFATMFFGVFVYLLTLNIYRYRKSGDSTGVAFIKLIPYPLVWGGLYLAGNWWKVAVLKYNWANHRDPQEWAENYWTAFGMIAMFLLMAVAGLTSRHTRKEDRFACAMLVLGLGVVGGVEVAHVRDFMGDGSYRSMNTLFKFHLHGWLLLGPMMAYGLWRTGSLIKEMLGGMEERLAERTWFWAGAASRAFILLVMAGAAFASWSNVSRTPMAWLPLSIIFAAAGSELGFFLAGRTVVYRLIMVPIASAGAIMIASGLMWTILGTRAKLTTEGRFRYGAGSLDGFAYKTDKAYDRGKRMYDGYAMRWIMENIKGRPRILEAIPEVPQYYDDHMQVVMNTGLITLAGWNSHISQWNSDGSNIVERRNDARTIFESKDVGKAVELLYKYDISYVYIGSLENERYDHAGFEKFDRFKEFFALRYANEGVKIYQVIDQRTQGPLAEKEEQTLVKGASDNVFTGGTGTEAGQFRQPGDIAQDSAGNIFVSDSLNNRVQKFGPEGTFMMFFGTEGSGVGQLKGPKGLAIGTNDEVHVADTLNDRVSVFTSDGRFLRTYGEGELFWPIDAALDDQGTSWVTDSGNGRLVRFGPDGKLLGTFGGHGRESGQFRMPMSLAIGQLAGEGEAPPATVLWVHDMGNSRMEAFDLNGRFLAAVPVQNVPDLTGGTPFLAAGPKHEMYLTDPARNVVDVYTNDGTLTKTLEPMSHQNDWQGPTGITFRSDGSGLIVSSQDGRLIRYERVSGVSMLAGGQGPGKGNFNEPRDLAVDGRGNIYVADFRNHRVQKFDAGGEFVTFWGGPGEGEQKGSFHDPCGIAVSPDGAFVYVADTWNHRVQKFDKNGKFIDVWENLFAPRGIAAGPDGNVYVADSGNARIAVFSPGGNPIRVIGARGTGAGQLQEPIGIQVRGDKVYVVDTWNQRVQVFSTTGMPLRQYKVPAWGEGESFREPYLDIGPNGEIYVTDPPKNRVLRINPDDGTVAEGGTIEGGRGNLATPMGIAVATNGDIYVTDTWNHRVAMLDKDAFRAVR